MPILAPSPGVSSPVTTDPLTFAGAVTFQKDVTVSAAGSTSGAPRRISFNHDVGEYWRIGDLNGGVQYNGLQGGNGGGGRMMAFAVSGMELRGSTGTAAPSPAVGGSPSDPAVTVLNTQAAVKALVVKAAPAQSASVFETQDSAGAAQVAFGPNTVGFYGVAPVARAAAIASPTAPSAVYVQAEAQSTKTAVDAIRVALTNLGLTL